MTIVPYSPAWHRKQRKRRARARKCCRRPWGAPLALLRRSAVLLQQHHGSAVPQATCRVLHAMSYWVCSCREWNWDSNSTCVKCHRAKPTKVGHGRKNRSASRGRSKAQQAPPPPHLQCLSWPRQQTLFGTQGGQWPIVLDSQQATDG